MCKGPYLPGEAANSQAAPQGWAAPSCATTSTKDSVSTQLTVWNPSPFPPRRLFHHHITGLPLQYPLTQNLPPLVETRRQSGKKIPNPNAVVGGLRSPRKCLCSQYRYSIPQLSWGLSRQSLTREDLRMANGKFLSVTKASLQRLLNFKTSLS